MLVSRSILAATCSTLLLTTTSAFAQQSQPGLPAPIYYETRNLTVYEEVTEFMEVTGNAGYGYPYNNIAFTGLGSVLLINNKLHNSNPARPNAVTTVLGTSRNVCTRVSSLPTVAQPADPRNDVRRISRCELTIELATGSVLASGVFYENDFEGFAMQKFGIIGGTGIYAGALGEVKLTQVVYPGAIVKLDINAKTIWNGQQPQP